MKPRISMIILGVDNLQRAIEFYEKGLGFPRMESPPEVAFFTLNGTWLGLYSRKTLTEKSQVTFEKGSSNSFALAHNLASEEEVCEVFDQAIKSGATPVKTPQRMFWGGYSGYFKDLDEHLWEVTHNPFIWVGPEDS